jgi:nucleotidyltransferase/DNA polymerase involved in DNA repair
MRDGFVLDINQSAQQRGVERGISLRQARAILEGGSFKTWQSQEYEARQRAWLDLCIDFSDVIEPADQHAAWLDLSLHPDPLDVVESLIRVLSQKTGLPVSYGIASSKWIAQLAASRDDCGLAIRDQAAFLSDLPTSDLLPIPPEHCERLRFLGYYKIGEVAKLPLFTLLEQFEDHGYLIHSAAQGTLKQIPRAIYPPDSVSESIIFDSPVESTETMFEVCQTLSKRIGKRLSSRGVQGGQLLVTLELEDGKLNRLIRTFTKPLCCARSVYTALRLLVAPALIAPIASIRAFLPDLVRVSQSQSSLSYRGSHISAVPVEAAVQRVRTVFGQNAVVLGNEVVLPRRVKVLREWKHATGWR